MIEVLRPIATGDVTTIPSQYPDSGAHWDKVDEVDADEDTTYVYQVKQGQNGRDLYHLPPSSGSGTINKITVHYRIKRPVTEGYVRGVVKANSTVSYKDYRYPTAEWGNFSSEWTVNPADGEPWEWADIDALQIGIFMGGGTAAILYCTQVYVEVDYTPEGVPPVPPTLEGWLPMPPNMGPPLPRFLQIFWPFYK